MGPWAAGGEFIALWRGAHRPILLWPGAGAPMLLCGPIWMTMLHMQGSAPRHTVLDHCSVCGLLVAARFNDSHPRCRPEARASVRAAPAPDPGGSFLSASIFELQQPVLRHVPQGALGRVAAENSLPAWRELLMLPKAVLRPAPRGSGRQPLQACQFTHRRCTRWLQGERANSGSPQGAEGAKGGSQVVQKALTKDPPSNSGAAKL